MQSERIKRRVTLSEIGMGVFGFVFVPLLLISLLVGWFLTRVFYAEVLGSLHKETETPITVETSSPDLDIDDYQQTVWLYSYIQSKELEKYTGRTFDISRSKWLYDGEILPTSELMEKLDSDINSSNEEDLNSIAFTCFNADDLNGVQGEVARDWHDHPTKQSRLESIPEPLRSRLQSTNPHPEPPTETDYPSCSALVDQMNDLLIKKGN